MFRCSATDSGIWRVVGGTGLYAGMTGQGQLTGTYYGGPAEFPGLAAGILDSYTGTVRLAGG